MKARHLLKFGLLLCALAAPLLAAAGSPQESKKSKSKGFAWTAREAEHLWNRAGFGASQAGIEHALELGQKAFVAELLGRGAMGDEYLPDHLVGRRAPSKKSQMPEMTSDERKQKRKSMRSDDRDQARDFAGWWVQRMLDGKDPLGERMTLFWHGHFTSSMEDVRNSFSMINQNELYREHALGNFGTLLREVARDPAMLEYLDSKSNVKDHPNENFARELLELFTLGEGNYTEDDIKAAARAFSGWTERNGEFVLRVKKHDFGSKIFLGEEGNLGGEKVLDIILEQDACARFMASKLIAYFEGQAPTDKRLKSYAKTLRKADFNVGEFLLKLFMDRAFYRKEVVGARIASPIDFLVGNARRLELEAPAELVLVGAGILGQRLFNPPNVKGWDGGSAWISSGTLMHRGNLAGVLLGEISLREFVDYDPSLDAEMGSMDESMDSTESMAGEGEEEAEMKRAQLGELRSLRILRGTRWQPRLKLGATLSQAGAENDMEIVKALCKRLLGVGVGPEMRKQLSLDLTAARESLGLTVRDFLRDPASSEPVLRSLAHLILSLPEAQLN